MQNKTWRPMRLTLEGVNPIPAPEAPSEEIPGFRNDAQFDLLHQSPPVQFRSASAEKDEGK